VTGDEISQLIITTMPRLELARDELRDLDAALGDGDLGITVAGGAAAISTAVAQLPEPREPAAVLRAAGRAFASSNPSTFSALVSAGLLAAARELAGTPDLDRAAAVRLLRTSVAAIQQRGGAVPGDKTVLDAILPSIDALEQAGPDASGALASMVAAAKTAVSETAAMQSQRGRAAWLGKRSAGRPDGGATAYVRFVEAVAASWPAGQ
jgi:phosphoenolpyruvate---glycerone phosphotransferase subunit DhaL